jgi:acetyl-CoA carboxylase biotin carboxyl carrier protein
MSELTLTSDVTGSVWRVLVAEGSNVAEDEVLIVVESMKMEIPITTSDAGQVLAILVKEGDAISEGDPVVKLKVA